MLVERPVLKLKINEGEESLHIGHQTIEHYLLAADIRPPFYIKEILSQEDWSLFVSPDKVRKRPPYSAEVMVGIILYGLMQGITSLRDLSRMARVDLGCIYLTEGAFPDSSSIGRFINRYQEVLTEEFFIHLTQSILKITRSRMRSVAGDGTIIEAAGSRYRLMKQEALEEKTQKARLKSEAHPADEGLKLELEKLERVSAELHTRITKRNEQHKPTDTVTISPIEPDAVVQPGKKGKASVPAYKPSVLANDARVVVAIDVHPSNEIESLYTLLDMTDKVSEGEVKELLLDGGYESHEVIQETLERDISLLCAPGKKKQKKS
ncbi:transposase [Legionella shakespearei]|uniref:Transposase InsH N-terminal domain-containing protein n=1 Tax=Legionella shakespearei DSM 23087 TaxID=1122169 RepID=A0A0W0YLE0_9GAMM|nr:transposase [Legionella shakespearei]KTD57540.1 hypothetical protein Lsha_2381 [Legionella shakespearei DSM 23087]